MRWLFKKKIENFPLLKKQRLDTQLKYLQTNFDELENTERRLIKEKREAQREVNTNLFTHLLNFFVQQIKSYIIGLSS